MARGPTPAPAPARSDPVLIEVSTAALLVAAAGWIDAIGYLHFSGLFLSFMSGNTTKMGIDLGRGDLAAAMLPLTAIGSFVLGSAFGTLIGGLAHRHAGAAVLAFVALLLAAVLLLDHGDGPVLLSILLMAMAMGAQNTAMQGAGGHSVGLTYVTGSLMKLGQSLAGLVQGKATGRECLLFAGMWLALISGAVAGAVAYRPVGLDALAVVTVLLVLMATARLVAAARAA